MLYEIFGPRIVSKDSNHIYMDGDTIGMFWESVEERYPGLSGACGCYVFGVRAAKGALPWYVGLAEKQSFRSECFTADKIAKYNLALRDRQRGTPILFFYAKVTATGRFARVSGNGAKDIQFLEKMLIGVALQRNSGLVNARDTKLLTEMVVPGYLNTKQGRMRFGAQDAKMLMGY